MVIKLTNPQYEKRRNELIEPAYQRAIKIVPPHKKAAFAYEFMKQMTEAAVVEGICEPENMTLFMMKSVNGITNEKK